MSNSRSISLFIVFGRTGHSLVVSKALPFASLEQVKEIYLFCESVGFTIPKCSYITVPHWIRNIKPQILSKLIRIFFEPLQLLYYTIKLKPDIINGIYCLPKGLNSFIISRITGVKCVNSVIGSVLEIETEMPFKKLWKAINLWQLRGCEAITIKGKTDRQYLISNGVAREKLFPLNGAIETEKYLILPDNKLVDILFVGNFYELKGPDRIMKIISRLTTSFPKLRVVLVGDGVMLEETKKMARDMKIADNILFEGFRKVTVPYFQNAKILLMPSRSESLPTSMLEAMACGCVPVISNVGNVKEAAKDGISAVIVEDYRDIDGFVNAVTCLLNNENQRRTLAENGRKIVEDNYSVKSQSLIAGNIIDYLNQT